MYSEIYSKIYPEIYSKIYPEILLILLVLFIFALISIESVIFIYIKNKKLEELDQESNIEIIFNKIIKFAMLKGKSNNKYIFNDLKKIINSAIYNNRSEILLNRHKISWKRSAIPLFIIKFLIMIRCGIFLYIFKINIPMKYDTSILDIPHKYDISNMYNKYEITTRVIEIAINIGYAHSRGLIYYPTNISYYINNYKQIEISDYVLYRIMSYITYHNRFNN